MSRGRESAGATGGADVGVDAGVVGDSRQRTIGRRSPTPTRENGRRVEPPGRHPVGRLPDDICRRHGTRLATREAQLIGQSMQAGARGEHLGAAAGCHGAHRQRGGPADVMSDRVILAGSDDASDRVRSLSLLAARPRGPWSVRRMDHASSGALSRCFPRSAPPAPGRPGHSHAHRPASRGSGRGCGFRLRRPSHPPEPRARWQSTHRPRVSPVRARADRGFAGHRRSSVYLVAYGSDDGMFHVEQP